MNKLPTSFLGNSAANSQASLSTSMQTPGGINPYAMTSRGYEKMSAPSSISLGQSVQSPPMFVSMPKR